MIIRRELFLNIFKLFSFESIEKTPCSEWLWLNSYIIFCFTFCFKKGQGGGATGDISKRPNAGNSSLRVLKVPIGQLKALLDVYTDRWQPAIFILYGKNFVK